MFTQSSCKSGANHSNVTLAFNIIKCGQFVDEVVCVAGAVPDLFQMDALGNSAPQELS